MAWAKSKLAYAALERIVPIVIANTSVAFVRSISPVLTHHSWFCPHPPHVITYMVHVHQIGRSALPVH